MRGFDWNWLALFSLSCVYTYRYNHAHIVSINEILATHRHIQHAAICTTKIHHSIGYNPLLQENLIKQHPQIGKRSAHSWIHAQAPRTLYTINQ